MAAASFHPDTLGTLCGLFRARVAATPDQVAYRQFDETRDTWVSFTWAQVAAEVARWQAALVKEGLVPGDRVAVMLKNSVEWVIFDQAALALGLVTVPLYLDDRPESAAYILNHSGARLLLVEGKFQHKKLAEIAGSAKHAATHRQPDCAGKRPGELEHALRGGGRLARRRGRHAGARAPSHAPTCWPASSTPRAPPGGPRA